MIYDRERNLLLEGIPRKVLKFLEDTPNVYLGGGYKKQAETWLRNQVGNNLLHVFNMGEFQKWANKGKI